MWAAEGFAGGSVLPAGGRDNGLRSYRKDHSLEVSETRFVRFVRKLLT